MPKPHDDVAAEPCGECEKIRLEHELTAADGLAASERANAQKDHELELTRELELEKIGTKARWDVEVATRASEAELSKLYHTTIVEISKGSVERARDSAKYIQTAAAAIAALYTALLGLVFSVTDHPLPVRGVYAVAFLGLAIAFATAYLAFVKHGGDTVGYANAGNLDARQQGRTFFLVRWINTVVRNRR